MSLDQCSEVCLYDLFGKGFQTNYQDGDLLTLVTTQILKTKIIMLLRMVPIFVRARTHWANFCLFCEKICHQFPETSAPGDF